MLLWSWVAFCLRAFVAALFITYACNKLLNLSDFATTIRRHHLIPDSLSDIAAKALSVVELGLGLLFLFNIFPLIAGVAISILLVVFSGILLRARFTPGLGIQDCGCSGTNKKKTPIGSALFRNVLLISASVVTMVTVSMHKNVSLSLSPLIEAILLLCIVAGIFCMRSGLFFSLSNLLNIEASNKDGRISTGRDGNRRSFIKWGVASLIGLSTFLNMTPIASAADISECPDGSDCGCGGDDYTYDRCEDGYTVLPVIQADKSLDAINLVPTLFNSLFNEPVPLNNAGSSQKPT
jgi:uncharacterized membrane protein YphA (DoxX/SURF4 family)